jgi:hypothetical protein
MSKSVEQTKAEVADIVHMVSTARERSADERAQAAMAVYEKTEAKGEYRQLLGDEAYKLIGRIKWLNRIKLLAHLGRRAVIAKNKHGELVTPMLFETEPEDIENEHITEGYTFKVTKSLDDTLWISRSRQEVAGVAAEDYEWWKVKPYWQAGALRVSFDSSQARDYRATARTELFKGFTQEHPWLKNYGFERRIDTVDDDQVLMTRSPVPYHLTGREPEPEPDGALVISILGGVQRGLGRGTGWEYPEEIYRQPLGLILQAQDELKGTFRP